MARVHRLRLLLNFLRTSERREEDSYRKKSGKRGKMSLKFRLNVVFLWTTMLVNIHKTTSLVIFLYINLFFEHIRRTYK